MQKTFNIGELNIPLPIVQGGMGVGVSSANLAAAVANEGGIGTISAVGLNYIYHNKDVSNASALAIEIRKARKLSPHGVLAVNIMFALTEFEELVKTSINEGIDIIFAGAGLPLELPRYLNENSKTKLIPIISSAKAAKIITRWWFEKYNYIPDGFVVEGPLAGGHLGFKLDEIDNPKFALENILPQVVTVANNIFNEYHKVVPVIAGGGIYSSCDVKKFLDLGASAVQLGTRFVATTECDACPAFKQAYIDSKKEDIIIIKSPVGMPGRAIQNAFTKKVALQEKTPTNCPNHCIKTCEMQESPYCISAALISAFKGNFNNGFAFIGANGYRVTKIVSVKELINELIMEI